MSMDLDVKITRNIDINHMLTNCQKELVNLSNFKEMPEMEIFQLKNGLKVELNGDHLLEPGELLIIKFKNMAEEISLAITEINLLLPYIDKDEAGIWGGVSVQGEDESKFLLAAGIALYLSNYCNSNVIDERCFWTTERESDYESFSSSLKNNKFPGNNVDFNLLCHLFYDMLPKGE